MSNHRPKLLTAAIQALGTLLPVRSSSLESADETTVVRSAARTGEKFETGGSDGGEPPSSRPDRRLDRARMVAVLAVIVGLLATPALASAQTVTFSVHNARGTALAGVYVSGVGPGKHTDGLGQITVNVAPGTTLNFSRAYGPDSAQCAPEGSGVKYTVNSSDSSVSIELPNMPGALYDAGLADDERGLAGLINQGRAESGLSPVPISRALNEAADRWASVIFDEDPNVLQTCQVESNYRAADAGWPSADKAGVYYPGSHFTTAREAYNAWSQQAGTKMMTSGWEGAVGIAHTSRGWVILEVKSCPTDSSSSRCELTGDFGDPALADTKSDTGSNGTGGDGAGTGDTGGSGTGSHNARLRLSVRRSGRRATATATVAGGARGAIRVYAQRGGKRIALRAVSRPRRSGTVSRQRFAAQLGAGHWRIVARFTGRAGWRSVPASRTIQVP